MVSFDFKRIFFLMENKDLPHLWKNPNHKKGLPKVLLTWGKKKCVRTKRGEKAKEERPKKGLEEKKRMKLKRRWEGRNKGWWINEIWSMIEMKLQINIENDVYQCNHNLLKIIFIKWKLIVLSAWMRFFPHKSLAIWMKLDDELNWIDEWTISTITQ